MMAKARTIHEIYIYDISLDINPYTHRKPRMHAYSTQPLDDQALKQQAISIHCADYKSIVSEKF